MSAGCEADNAAAEFAAAVLARELPKATTLKLLSVLSAVSAAFTDALIASDIVAGLLSVRANLSVCPCRLCRSFLPDEPQDAGTQTVSPGCIRLKFAICVLAASSCCKDTLQLVAILLRVSPVLMVYVWLNKPEHEVAAYHNIMS